MATSIGLMDTKRMGMTQNIPLTSRDHNRFDPLEGGTDRGDFTQANSLLKQIMQNKSNSSQRRLIIGFEANKNTNGNYLRKLDRMISVSSRPKSRVS